MTGCGWPGCDSPAVAVMVNGDPTDPQMLRVCAKHVDDAADGPWWFWKPIRPTEVR